MGNSGGAALEEYKAVTGVGIRFPEQVDHSKIAGMSDIVGIDLGTTNSLIGVVDAGFPILLADSEGVRLTPSVVYLPPDGEPLIGRPAVRMRALKPADTIYSIKRFIGRRNDELIDDDLRTDYEVARKKAARVESQ